MISSGHSCSPHPHCNGIVLGLSRPARPPTLQPLASLTALPFSCLSSTPSFGWLMGEWEGSRRWGPGLGLMLHSYSKYYLHHRLTKACEICSLIHTVHALFSPDAEGAIFTHNLVAENTHILGRIRPWKAWKRLTVVFNRASLLSVCMLFTPAKLQGCFSILTGWHWELWYISVPALRGIFYRQVAVAQQNNTFFKHLLS